MRYLTTETFYEAIGLTKYVNMNHIEQKDIVSINTIVDADGQYVFHLFYYYQ